MYWNYRIVRHGDAEVNFTYIVHEVDYEDDGTIICVVDAPVMDDTAEGLHKVLDMIKNDITHNPEILDAAVLGDKLK